MSSGKAMLLWLLCGLGATLSGEAMPRPAPTTERAHDKYLEFAKKLEAKLGESGTVVLMTSLDWDALLDRATMGPTPGAKLMDEFRQAIRRGLSEPSDASATDHYRFLRVRAVGGSSRALFRKVTEDNLDYRELALGLDSKGAVQLKDFYDHTNGEWLSDVVRVGWLAFLREKRPDLLAALPPEESILAESLLQLDTLRELEASGKRREALSWFDKLPPSVQDRRAVLLRKLGVALRFDATVHSQTVERFRHLHPNDPVVDLAEFNRHAWLGQDGPALAALGRFEKALGGDPYLDHLRAQVFFQKKDLSAAKALEQKVVQTEPHLPEPYWELLAISLEERDHAETARLLTQMERSLGIAFKDLRQSEGYRAFVESKEYEAWANRRPSAAAGADGDPVSEAEGRELAGKIETAVAAGNEAAFDGLIDWDVLLDEVMEGIPLEAPAAAAFRAGALQSRTLANEVVTAVGKQGSYRFLRQRRADGRLHLLFRLLTAEGVLNYHEMRLRRAPNGEPRIEDVYIYAAGQWFTQLLRELAAPALAEMGNGLVGLREGESEYVRSMDQIGQLRELQRAGKAKQAEEVYDRLPPSVQNNRTVLLIAIMVKAQLGAAPFEQALARFRRLHPHDPALHMLELGAYASRGEYDRALEAVDVIEAAVGGDPYLGFLRGSILLKKGAKTTAKAAFDEAIAADPGLRQAYFALVEMALGDRDFAETARLLNVIETELGLEMNPKNARVFEDFVKSREYETWLKERGRR